MGDVVRSVRRGDRVIVPFQVSCGTCESCRRGLTASCATAGAGAAYGMAPIARREWGGALSDCVRVPYADAMLVALLPTASSPRRSRVSPTTSPTAGARSRRSSSGGRARRCWWSAARATSRCTRWRSRSRSGASRSTTSTSTRGGWRWRSGSARTRSNGRPTAAGSGATRSPSTTAARRRDCRARCVDGARGHVHVDRDLLRRRLALPLLDMYTRGVVFRTGRVNARAAIPHVLDLVRCRPAAARARDERDGAVGRRSSSRRRRSRRRP